MSDISLSPFDKVLFAVGACTLAGIAGFLFVGPNLVVGFIGGMALAFTLAALFLVEIS